MRATPVAVLAPLEYKAGRFPVVAVAEQQLRTRQVAESLVVSQRLGRQRPGYTLALLKHTCCKDRQCCCQLHRPGLALHTWTFHLLLMQDILVCSPVLRTRGSWMECCHPQAVETLEPRLPFFLAHI